MSSFNIQRYMFYKGRSIYGLYVRGISRPGVYRDILSIFAERGINILYFSTTVAERGEEGVAICFFDLTGITVPLERLVNEIRGIRGVKMAAIIPPKFEGFIADTISFPLMLGDARAVMIDESALRGLLRDVRKRMGSGGEAMLYHFGFETGLDWASYVVREAEGIGLTEPLEKLSIAADIFKALGYGVIEEIKAFREEPPYMEVKVSGNIECALGVENGDGETYSHFIRGVLAGFTTRIFDREMYAQETRCIVRGDPHCEFIIKPKRPQG